MKCTNELNDWIDGQRGMQEEIK